MTGQRPDWRSVAAALADDRVRAAYARIVLGESLDDALSEVTASARAKVRDTLTRSRLIVIADDGAAWATSGLFRELLAAQPVAVERGIERYLRDGRIDRYPSNAAERRELLEVVARRALRPGEALSEQEINGRLAAFADDVALLRRRLVDEGLVERTRSGSSYALAP